MPGNMKIHNAENTENTGRLDKLGKVRHKQFWYDFLPYLVDKCKVKTTSTITCIM